MLVETLLMEALEQQLLPDSDSNVIKLETLSSILDLLEQERGARISGIWFDHVAVNEPLAIPRADHMLLVTDGRVVQLYGGTVWRVEHATVCIAFDRRTRRIVAAHIDLFELRDRANFSLQAYGPQKLGRHVFFRGAKPPEPPANY